MYTHTNAHMCMYTCCMDTHFHAHTFAHAQIRTLGMQGSHNIKVSMSCHGELCHSMSYSMSQHKLCYTFMHVISAIYICFGLQKILTYHHQQYLTILTLTTALFMIYYFLLLYLLQPSWSIKTVHFKSYLCHRATYIIS